jgi:hypothetical protein
MGNKTWLRSHVERCLQEVWDLRRVRADSDGDYPFRWGTAACWVSIDTRSKPAMITVFAHAAFDVPRSGKMLREINDVNRASRLANVAWCEGLVVVKYSTLASGIDRKQFKHICAAVGSVADDIGTLLTSVHGGSTPFPPVEVASDGGAL